MDEFNVNTIRECLTAPKPDIYSQANAKNSLNRKWPNVNQRIGVWKEFTIETLNNTYGHILDQEGPAAPLPPPTPQHFFSGKRINNDKDAKELTIWNSEAGYPALVAAQGLMGLHSGTGLVSNYKSAENGTFTASLNQTNQATVKMLPANIPPVIRADHVVYLNDSFPSYLVVGISKPADKFDTSTIARDEPMVTQNQAYLLDLLASVCRKAGTRYGYIQTNRELVACLFTPDEGKVIEGREHWTVKIMPVPWSKHGTAMLTTDLAVWWLCLLAMSDRKNRELVPKGDVVPINHWDFDESDTPRYIYSKREVSEEVLTQYFNDIFAPEGGWDQPDDV